MEVKTLIKRFQFDLEMDVFKNFYNECYDAGSNDKRYSFFGNLNDIKLMASIIRNFDFQHQEEFGVELFHCDKCGIIIDMSNKQYWFFPEREYNEEEDNPVPDYIKEFGIIWHLREFLKDFNLI